MVLHGLLSLVVSSNLPLNHLFQGGEVERNSRKASFQNIEAGLLCSAAEKLRKSDFLSHRKKKH
jgi:hypothetical protein